MTKKSKDGNEVDNRGVSNALKLRILRRDGYQCVYCGKSGQNSNLEIDHRIPHTKGGDNHISNLYTACVECNRKKGTETWDVRKGYSPIKINNAENRMMKTSPLDGVCVHIFNEPDKTKRPGVKRYVSEVDRQGQVLGIFQDEHIAVQLFSWLDGRPTNIELFPIENVIDGTMVFYVDDIEMKYAYENMRERRDEDFID